jgi:hypothetical protein
MQQKTPETRVMIDLAKSSTFLIPSINWRLAKTTIVSLKGIRGSLVISSSAKSDGYCNLI